MKPALLALALFVFTSMAHASKDWTLTEESDLLLNAPACRASTTVAKSTLPVELAIAFPKDQLQLPVVYVKITGLTNHAPLAMIRFDRKEFQPLFLLSSAATAGDPDIYWYAPAALPKLLDLVKSADTIDIAFDPKSPTPVPVRFSLAGSSSILDQTEKCLKVKSLLPEEFLKALNQQTEFTGTLPAAFTAADVLALTQTAFKDYVAGRSASSALAALRKVMKPLTDKEAEAQADFDRRQRHLDETTADLTKRQTEISTLEQQLVQFASDQTQLQTDKATADQNLALKKAIYDPAKAQLAPLERDVSKSEDALTSARRAINAQRSRIDNDQAALKQLANEDASLRSNISYYEGQLSSANSDLSRAQSNLNGYNVSSERDRILRSDYRYSSLKNDIPRRRQEAQQARSELWQAQSAVSSAQNALNSCNSTPNANCSSQQSALSQAKSRVNDCNSRINNAENDCRRMESELQNCESDADRKARSEYDDLQSIRNRAADVVNDLQSRRNGAVSRVNQINGSDIPAYRNDLANARAALSKAERQKADAQKDLDDANVKLAQTKTQIGFEQIENDYTDAKAEVRRLADALEAKADAISKATKTLAKTRPIAADLAKTQAKEAAVRDTAKGKLDVIQTQLQPQRQQEAALQAQVDAAKATLAQQRALYQAESKALAELPLN